MGTWGAAGLEVWTRDAEAARRPIVERKSTGSIEGGPGRAVGLVFRAGNADVLQDHEALLIQGARHFCQHQGFLDTFSFLAGINPCDPEFFHDAVQVVIDAKIYDSGGIGRPYRFLSDAAVCSEATVGQLCQALQQAAELQMQLDREVKRYEDDGAEFLRAVLDGLQRVKGLAVDRDRTSAAMRSEANFDFDVKMEGTHSSTQPIGDVNSRRFENAVWRLMQKEKRTTWNEECLRKAVATIGKEIDFSCMTSSTSNKEAVSHHLPEPLGGPAVSRKRRTLDNRAASLPNPQGSLLDVQRLENAVWRLWPREQRAWQPWYSVLPDEGEKASEELGSQLDLLQVQRLLHKQDVLSQFAFQLVQRAHSIGAQSTETPATPRSLASSQEETLEEEEPRESTGWATGWVDAAVPTAWILGGVLMAVGALRAVKGM